MVVSYSALIAQVERGGVGRVGQSGHGQCVGSGAGLTSAFASLRALGRSMSCKLFVANFPYSTTNEELNTLFGPHGQVLSVKIATDRETGRSRGFGFVEMGSEQEADNAIRELDGYQLGGRSLAVRVAEERSRPGGPGGPGGGPRGPRGPRSDGGGGGFGGPRGGGGGFGGPRGGGGFGGPRDDMGGFGGPRGPRGPRSGPRY